MVHGSTSSAACGVFGIIPTIAVWQVIQPWGPTHVFYAVQCKGGLRLVDARVHGRKLLLQPGVTPVVVAGNVLACCCQCYPHEDLVDAHAPHVLSCFDRVRQDAGLQQRQRRCRVVWQLCCQRRRLVLKLYEPALGLAGLAGALLLLLPLFLLLFLR